MPSLYQRITHLVIDSDGLPWPRAQVTVTRKSDGQLAFLYPADNLGGTPQIGVATADERGVIDFYAGDLSDAYDFALAGGTVALRDVAVDTVENHRRNPNHAPASIDPSEIDIVLNPSSDLAIHESKVRGVHGVPNSSGTERVAWSTEGANGSSPTFGTVMAEALEVDDGGTFLGFYVVNDFTELQAALALANAGETIFLRAGVYTCTAQITINSNVRIIGGGGGVPQNNPTHGAVLVQASDFGTFISLTTSSETVILEDLTVRAVTASSAAIRLEGGRVFARNVHVRNFSGGYGWRFVESGGGGQNTFLTDCSGACSVLQALRIESWSGAINVVNSDFTTQSASNDAVRLLGPTIPTGRGHTFHGCTFSEAGGKDAVHASIPRTVFLGCNFATNGTGYGLKLVAGADDTYCPLTANRFSNASFKISDVDGLLFQEWNRWDYVSGWIEIDNTAPTYTSRYIVVGELGVGDSFSHGLGTRNVEVLIQVSDTAAGAGAVWTFSSGTATLDTNVSPATGGYITPQVIDENSVGVVLYAGKAQTGAGAFTASGKYVWQSPKAQSIDGSKTMNSYDFTSVNGYALDHIWVRVLVRRIVGVS